MTAANDSVHHSSAVARRAGARGGPAVTVAGTLAAIVAIAVALIVVAVLAPRIPVLGVVGSLLGNRRAGKLLVAGAVALGAGVGLHLLGRRRLRVLVSVPAIVALVGSMVVVGAQLHAARAVGAGVDAADVFGVGSAATPPDATPEIARLDGTALNASVWRTPAGVRPRSAVLWVHGGGFNAGSRDEQAGMARYLAGHGYPVVSVDYRLHSAQPWRDETDDVVCGLGWVEHHAGSLGTPAGRVSVVGGSAGGSLALNVAYGMREHSVASSCGWTPTAAPRSVAAFYPVADIAGVAADNGDAPVSQYAHTMTDAYLDGSPSAVPSRLSYASPASKIRPGLQPTLLVNGANDSLIRPQRNRRFVDRLHAAGDRATFQEVPFSDHMYDASPHSIGAAISRALLLHFLSRNA